MKFEEFAYRRPDLVEFTQRFESLLLQFDQAGAFEEQQEAFKAINRMRTEFLSLYNICLIRHTTNTLDQFYEEENNFFDEAMPQYEALNHRFYQALVGSTYRPRLEAEWGKQLFVIAELTLKTFKPEILEDLQEENRLSSEYTKLKAGAEIEFEGKIYNLSSIYTQETARDRSIRKAAAEAKWRFFTEHAGQLDRIFDELVKVRTRIARKLGYQNYVPLGYARMLRTDYNAEMVARFREQIRQYIVPIATELYDRQRRRLGLEKLKYYDEDFRFVSGNPEPKGDPDWIVEQAKSMYGALSPETAEFFRFMLQQNLMDLTTKPGKATGGYCTYIGEYKAPYIFSNFNGTSGDIDVLTHEAGHAFQVFSSRDIGINEYNWPTFEACEIHSMSMEFFTWPWMELFFKEDTNKYKFSHLANALYFLPYGVAVDEFQHFVYENPEAGPADRNREWIKIEQKYLPHRDYDGNKYLESGGFWQKQTHIYGMPFYYIDYTLAQICAFQFWKKDRNDHQQAWEDYLRLCKAGGSKSFLGLVNLANLHSPFDEKSVQSIVGDIKTWLDHVDDQQF